MSEKESATTSKPPSTESRHEPEVILTYPSERKVGKKINRDSQSVGPQISPDDFNYSQYERVETEIDDKIFITERN